ncbi:dihydrolipoyl dehydrogenase family protein [Sulfurisphaera tokodaii]|uniref:Dihydrolipoyl dehydrogenase n=2 Tax=Sulfurisphaera tokodaii TaxID=111955 RepID=Q96ZG9_SULTO|nr:NAD(P)/FAD-dependent oxidoreductase [Sulfurisphaera tokodaii]BAB66956.1 putative dihydrolipoyl dehydrogenase [Sulfurisphaera tokodaii str. 7]HII75389.1 NAD(P)/FAD-dependent oxidoreductase [Sulfurisphaera tokodaii]
MIVVIGSGPAGIYGAFTASALGEKVKLIEEKERLGGTCVLYGCIPSKAMLHPLYLKYSLERLGKKIDFSYEELIKLAQDAISRISKGVEYMLESYGVEVIYGRGVLKSKEIEVSGQTLYPDKVLVATGTLKPEINGTIASDDLPYLNKEFNSVTVIGGGVGGIEYGWLLHKIGKEVHIVEKENLLLPKHDMDLRNYVTNHFKRIGVKLHLGVEAKIENNKVKLSNGEEIKSDIILMSFGRKPNLTGVESLPHDYWIKVNEYMETPIKDIYAAGDITGSFTAHEAIHKGYIAGLNMKGIKKPYDSSAVPKVIYTSPQIAYVGNTNSGRCMKMEFSGLARAIAEKETEGFLKICVENEKVIGGVAFSERAEEIISLLALGIKFKGSLDELLDFQYPHPSYLEMIWEILRKIKWG